MAAPHPYTSRLAWTGERPDTLVVACSDGRWWHQIQEFVAHLGAAERTDMFIVPGGVEPLTLADVMPKDYNFAHRRLEMVMRMHRVQRVVAIAHHDCAWYRTRPIGRGRGVLRDQQVADLRAAARWLVERFPNLRVETFYARLAGTDPERVAFDPV
jgi:hypothetical protein